MRLEKAIESFCSLVQKGELVHRTTRDPLELTDGEVAEILSDVQIALAYAAGVSVASSIKLELDPYAATLEKIARKCMMTEAHRERTRMSESTGFFLFTIYGQSERHEHPPRGSAWPCGASRVLPPWQPVYGLFLHDETGKGNLAKLRTQTLAIQDLCLVHGIRAPSDVPEYTIVSKWVADLMKERGCGHVHTRIGEFLKPLRYARKVLGHGLPDLHPSTAERHRGVNSLPDLAVHLKQAGCDRSPREMEVSEILDVLAPKLACALFRYVEEGRKRRFSRHWIREQTEMADHFIAEFIRMGLDVSGMSWLDVFEREIDVAPPEPDPLLEHALGKEYATNTRESLLRVVMDRMAIASSRLSRRKRLTGSATLTEGEVPFYTSVVIEDVVRAFRLVQSVFSHATHALNPARWAAIQERYDTVHSYALSRNNPLTITGGKTKSRVPLLLPHLVCIGLPAHRRSVLEVEARMEAYLERGDSSSPEGKRLIEEFDRTLTEYILTSIVVDDGLRSQNYSGALANEHFLPDVTRDESGRWIGFSRMRTWFHALDDELVRLKPDRNKPLDGQERGHSLSRAIVDHRLLFRYWVETRPRSLVMRRLISSVDEFDPDHDHFAVFIANKSGQLPRSGVRNPRVAQSGQMTAGYLSQMLGRVLHWIARDVLGRTDLPKWEDPELSTAWYGLFSAHVVRLLLGTYWGGMRGNWGYACYITNDTEITLRNDYNDVRSAIAAQEYELGPKYARRFDEVMDRLLEHNPNDDWDLFWEVFDPESPDAALGVLSDHRV